jgi:predicted peroxiredoxin
VSMALGLAGAAAKEGREVVVFLNVEAPQFAVKDLGDSVKAADFPPVKNLLADVMASGGKVYVCGHCAQVCNVDKASFVAGVVLASHADILAQMKPGMVGLSY